MTELLTYKGRLPGVVVDVSPPSPIPTPLRLDVAGLVGFAERGPLDTPVLVEDTSQYQAIFGGDLPVARDEGRPVYACLPRVVHGFFDNGGRRSYVVRVAGEGARPNEFHIPGLFTWSGSLAPVIQPAAWPGDWSDVVRIGTQLRSDPLRVAAHTNAYRVLPVGESETGLDGIELDLELSSVDMIRDGDLLRLHLPGIQLYAQVQVIEPLALLPSLHSIPATVVAAADHMLAFEVDFAKPAALPDTIEYLDGRDWVTLASGALPDDPNASSDSFVLNLPVDTTLTTGDLLRLNYADGTIVYLPVTDVTRTFNAALSPEPFQQVTGQEALKVLTLSRDVVDLTLRQVDLLTFDLYIREGQATLEIWRELHFGKVPATPANVNNPASQQRASRFWMTPLAHPVDSERLWVTSEELQQRSLRLGAQPLPTDSEGIEIVPFYLPLGMSELQPCWHDPLPYDPSSTLPDSKNGLDKFDPETLFLDADFNMAGIGRIMAVAEDLLYLGAERVKLTGAHSLLGVPEVALIALPDILHRGWTDPEPPADDVVPDDEQEPENPDLSQFDECEPPSEEPDDEPEPLDVPVTPVVEISRLPVLKAEADYDIVPLIAVQQALINLCAARADMVCILSVPQHFDLRAVLSWQQQITQRFLGFSGDPLSYAAVYHPWVNIREETTPELAPLRSIPPDGAVCGMIAARELARGPWIAPANESLRGAVGLVPAISQSEHIALFNQHINVLVHQPGRFAVMSAHTLNPDRLLLQISVRRLLIYVRKLLLREGHRWVFETNNARFRQFVQISLERMLSRIQALGGLAAFQVVTGTEVNTLNDYDNGRFIVAVKLAPTTPVEFITVVLLRTGENLLEIIER